MALSEDYYKKQMLEVERSKGEILKQEAELLEEMLRKQDRQIALLERISRIIESRCDDGR